MNRRQFKLFFFVQFAPAEFFPVFPVTPVIGIADDQRQDRGGFGIYHLFIHRIDLYPRMKPLSGLNSNMHRP